MGNDWGSTPHVEQEHDSCNRYECKQGKYEYPPWERIICCFVYRRWFYRRFCCRFGRRSGRRFGCWFGCWFGFDFACDVSWVGYTLGR